MITIWGRRNSSNVMPVMWTVGELGLEHERRDVGGSFGGLDTPEYGAINPNRMVPTLQDGDFTLWESNAIVRYLTRKYGDGTLLPDTAEEVALADQWMDWQRSRITPPTAGVFAAIVRREPADRDQTMISKLSAQAASAFTILDAHLSDRNFIVGNRLTMADVPMGAQAYRYFNLEIERPSLPNVEAWYARLQEREAYRTHIMNPFGRNPGEWYMLERGITD